MKKILKFRVDKIRSFRPIKDAIEIVKSLKD